MPLDLLVNGAEIRVVPSKDYQLFPISEHSQVEVADWKIYVNPVEKIIIYIIFSFYFCFQHITCSDFI